MTNHEAISDAYDMAINALTAQPEPCVDTIDALNESIKHFDDMAEECRRNANIERNDYMDMRDDAAEYRQLSIWLNELKWLRERFQSQPEPHWIPCSRELPDTREFTSKTVLCCDKYGGIYTATYNKLGEWHDDAEYADLTDVIAWMPLPEPYREDEGC